MDKLDRRSLLRALAAIGAGALVAPRTAAAQSSPLLTRKIPSSGEALPLIGLGTWVVFNVGSDPVAREQRTRVLRDFFSAGGRLIDSSPMYGSSQEVIGHGLTRLGRPAALFSADKVWTGSGPRGPAQIEASRRAWTVPRFDLLQVHNLVAWKEHLPALFAMKAAGRVRYVGVTTSHGRRHDDLEVIMRTHLLDFVQVTYNVVDREVEQRILPLARERGIAVLINRPFQEGALIRRLDQAALPAWARELDCTGWPQFLLKFIVSHPAVTCAIPATTNPAHVVENMGASRGRMPSEADRRRMIEHIRSV
jgi:diketogulonate reductase-like aldo/keto reductase